MTDLGIELLAEHQGIVCLTAAQSILLCLPVTAASRGQCGILLPRTSHEEAPMHGALSRA